MAAKKSTKAPVRISKKTGKPVIKTKPRIEIDLDQVEELASHGLTDSEIALNLGISISTLEGRKRSSEEFKEAIARGKAKGIRQVANALFQIATNNGHRQQTDAAKFYLARRADWRETQIQEHTGKDGGAIQVTISKDDADL
jgi:hypothetical protein